MEVCFLHACMHALSLAPYLKAYALAMEFPAVEVSMYSLLSRHGNSPSPFFVCSLHMGYGATTHHHHIQFELSGKMIKNYENYKKRSHPVGTEGGHNASLRNTHEK